MLKVPRVPKAFKVFRACREITAPLVRLALPEARVPLAPLVLAIRAPLVRLALLVLLLVPPVRRAALVPRARLVMLVLLQAPQVRRG